MKIIVKVKTGKTLPAGRQEDNQVIEKDDQFFVSLKSKPIKGQANRELIDILSKYFKKPKSNIKIVCGEKSKSKIIEIM